MDIVHSVFYLLISFSFFLSNPTLLLVHSQLQPISNDTQMQVYIVHVQKPDSTSFRRFKDRKEWYASFLPNTTLDSGKPRMIYAYRRAIRGFAAWLTAQEAEAMKSMDGVLVAYSDFEYDAQTTYTPQFLGLNAWEDGIWYDSQYGAGQIIGVIDTGFKPGHPSFRDTDVNPPPGTWNGSCYWKQSVCNNKLIGAVGYRFGRTVSPEDNNGHGTHTASTAAGNFVDDAHVLGMARGTASGTAPKAHLAIYKVLHNTKTATGTVAKAFASDTLRGIDEAIRNHVNVLSMSLGTVTHQLHANPIAIASYAAITEGIVPVACAMNEGPYKSIIANDAPWILTVGASTTDRRIRAIVKLGNGMEFFGETAYQPEGFNSTQLPLVYPGVLQTQKTLNCKKGSMDTFDVKGKIVLCGVGHISNIEKGEVVKAAGGAAMILMNQPWNGNTTYAEPHVIPTAHVSFSDAWKILTYFNSMPDVTAAIIFNGTQYGARPSPSVAFFSSRGPSLMNGNIIKPDVIAPGVNVLAAWPFEVGPKPDQHLQPTTHTFNFDSGTSMATPHVAGIVAMLKNNHPDWSPAAIKSAIMTTAYMVDADGNPIGDDSKPAGTPASAYAMGSGHVDPLAANDPGLVYDLHYYDYIHYLCGMGFTDAQVGAIGRGSVQCSKVRAISPEQLNYPSMAVYLSASTTQVTVDRTVTNVGDAVSTYEVKYDEPEGVRVEVTPDTLQFSRAGQMKDFQVTLSVEPGSPTVRMAGQVFEGQMAWVSGKYYVRSPIAVTIQ
ncbi:subtilisin-like protease SBT1.7 [Ananas comosus]|uniref:Subtilisin-like protease SBT1.7 n=1 Tax=Ananas comosus TaxID=4615 RepID=A0A6P5EF76_ANACO|nr:subtilisin-like protease SBT1.7 [Ananas comosus]